jgi:hypothetical protein
VELSGTKSALKASRLLFLLASKGKERRKIANFNRSCASERIENN